MYMYYTYIYIYMCWIILYDTNRNMCSTVFMIIYNPSMYSGKNRTGSPTKIHYAILLGRTP